MDADFKADLDRGELPSLMEPLLFNQDSRFRKQLTEQAFELVQRSTALRYGLPPAIVRPLSGLVRAMNCYYSNLIEGHDTHPVDIERALHQDFSKDDRQRDLQLEALAHIAVQQWLDEGGLPVGYALTVGGIREIHRCFFGKLPVAMWSIPDPGKPGAVQIIPGEFRHQDVSVGRHIPISPGAIPRFMTRFEAVYSKLGKVDAVLNAAAIHHRLSWIHPFLDGNGRVTRLVTHACLSEVLNTGSIWSVARGLARRATEYKQHLAACDQSRRNDLDGRGTLSEEALHRFTEFLLDICLDQVNFMTALLRPADVRTRILVWAAEEMRSGRLLPQSGNVLDAILYRVELPRAEVAGIVGTGDRQARRVVEALVKSGALEASGPRTPLRLALPVAIAARWLPGLIPHR